MNRVFELTSNFLKVSKQLSSNFSIYTSSKGRFISSVNIQASPPPPPYLLGQQFGQLVSHEAQRGVGPQLLQEL